MGYQHQTRPYSYTVLSPSRSRTEGSSQVCRGIGVDTLSFGALERLSRSGSPRHRSGAIGPHLPPRQRLAQALSARVPAGYVSRADCHGTPAMLQADGQAQHDPVPPTPEARTPAATPTPAARATSRGPQGAHTAPAARHAASRATARPAPSPAQARRPSPARPGQNGSNGRRATYPPGRRSGRASARRRPGPARPDASALRLPPQPAHRAGRDGGRGTSGNAYAHANRANATARRPRCTASTTQRDPPGSARHQRHPSAAGSSQRRPSRDGPAGTAQRPQLDRQRPSSATPPRSAAPTTPRPHAARTTPAPTLAPALSDHAASRRPGPARPDANARRLPPAPHATPAKTGATHPRQRRRPRAPRQRPRTRGHAAGSGSRWPSTALHQLGPSAPARPPCRPSAPAATTALQAGPEPSRSHNQTAAARLHDDGRYDPAPTTHASPQRPGAANRGRATYPPGRHRSRRPRRRRCTPAVLPAAARHGPPSTTGATATGQPQRPSTTGQDGGDSPTATPPAHALRATPPTRCGHARRQRNRQGQRRPSAAPARPSAPATPGRDKGQAPAAVLTPTTRQRPHATAHADDHPARHDHAARAVRRQAQHHQRHRYPANPGARAPRDGAGGDAPAATPPPMRSAPTPHHCGHAAGPERRGACHSSSNSGPRYLLSRPQGVSPALG